MNLSPYEFIKKESSKYTSILDDRNAKEIFHKSLLRPYEIETTGEWVYPTNVLNGSICKFKDKILFAYRVEQAIWFQKTRIGICELTEDFQVKPETVRYLKLHCTQDGYHTEDPRLFVCDGTLCLVYCDGYRMASAILDDNGDVYHSGYFPEFQVSNSESHDGREKNWTPFEYKKQPHYIYSDNPRFILKYDLQKTYIPKQDVSWKYGPIRGGTPAISYDDDHFITFFHSARNYPEQSGWPRIYFIGAYLFRKTPPFKVTAITTVPLLKGIPPKIEYQRPAKEVLVLFPSGIISEDQGFHISYGFCDYTNKVIFVSRELLKLLFNANLQHINK